MIGTCSARLRTVTVVDLLPAPPDSRRSASLFVLGTEGLAAAIKARHIESGSTLFLMSGPGIRTSPIKDRRNLIAGRRPNSPRSGLRHRLSLL